MIIIMIHHDSMIFHDNLHFWPFPGCIKRELWTQIFLQKDSRFQNDCPPNLKLEDARTTREAKHRVRIARVLQVSRLMRCNCFAPLAGTGFKWWLRWPHLKPMAAPTSEGLDNVRVRMNDHHRAPFDAHSESGRSWKPKTSIPTGDTSLSSPAASA